MRTLAAPPVEKRGSEGNRDPRAQKVSKVKQDHRGRRACLVPKGNPERPVPRGKKGIGANRGHRAPKVTPGTRSTWQGAIQALQSWRPPIRKGMAATPI